MTALDNAIPVIPLRTRVLLPGEVAPLEVGRAISRRAVDAALAADSKILLVPQKDAANDEVAVSDLRNIGIEAEIIQAIPLSKTQYTVVVRADRRVWIDEVVQTSPFPAAKARPFDDVGTPADADALTSVLLDNLAVVIDHDDEDPSTTLTELDELSDPGALADFAASRLTLSEEQRLELLSNPDVGDRLRVVTEALARYVDVLAMKADIREELEQDIGAGERQSVLLARKRSILAELGEEDDGDSPELDELELKIAETAMSEEAERAARKQLRRLRQMNPASPEHSTTRTYVDTLLAIPWLEESVDRHDVARAREILDEDHDGLDDVKKRILEFIAVRKLVPDKHGPILCLVGPPGVGKTSLGRSIARALEREYVRASLGGVRDEAEIRGHRRTYIGSLPGRIAAGLKKVGTINPVFVLDEIDKLASDHRGDPSSALLEVLDPEQNHEFVDHYVEVPIDLSKVMFLATANRLDTIPAPLLDRMEVIEIPGYTDIEKREIARNHLVPRQLEEHGLKVDQVELSDAALEEIANHYTREAGVRNLEREIAAVIRNIAVKAAIDDAWEHEFVSEDDIATILGPRKFYSDIAEQTDQIGVVTGMAWTPVGGQILFVEARLMPGRGNLKVTGQLGDVMEESVRAAHSWVRANAERLGIELDALRNNDVHVHLPQGAVRKDGPSAGVAIATALVSLYTGVPARHEIAITGEVTLRGQVLPVGGIKNKLLAAHRAGVTTVVLPERNRKDLAELPESVLGELDVRFAARVDEALDIALRSPHDHVEPTPPVPPPLAV
jgi:ATP-dependent Lon protease